MALMQFSPEQIMGMLRENVQRLPSALINKFRELNGNGLKNELYKICQIISSDYNIFTRI